MYLSRFLSASSIILLMGTLSLFAGEKTTSDSDAECVRHSTKASGTPSQSKMNCPKSDSTQGKSHVSIKISTTPDKQILFFMNPNGHPCQMQLSIFDGMKEKLSGLATIKYIKTTEPGDEEAFYKYRIRGLPSLIIIDKNDKEIKRFTPGIQDEKTILSALKGSDK
jgi:hypothetical protein